MPFGPDLSSSQASRLQSQRHPSSEPEGLVFRRASGAPLTPETLRKMALQPAARRAGIDGVGLHTFRHTCAALLIEQGASPLRLQRWMGHHSAAYTLDAYGHLIDGEMGAALECKDIGLGDVSGRS